MGSKLWLCGLLPAFPWLLPQGIYPCAPDSGSSCAHQVGDARSCQQQRLS